MTVLVTGGAGFIGSHVVTGLLDAGHDVRVLDLLDPDVHAGPPDLDPRAELVRGDVRDVDVMTTVLDGVDTVCHQAAMVGLGVDIDDITAYVSHNDVGTAALLRALHRRGGCERLVLASSMVIYGEGAYCCDHCGPRRPGPRTRRDLDAGRFEPPCPSCAAPLHPALVDEDAPPDPRNVYAATKLHQEHLCQAFARETGTPLTVLRYHNVYGPRMPRDTPYAGVASIFRSVLSAGTAPQVFEDGGQRRDFVHVRDVAQANVLAVTAATARPGTYNVASGEPHTVLEMAAALAAATDGPAPQVVPRYRLGDVRHVVASPDRAATGLGFRARVSFDEGMREFATAPLRPPA